MHVPASTLSWLEGADGMKQPILEDQHIPQQILPVAGAGNVLLPFLADNLDGKQVMPAQAFFRKQGLSPVPQRAPQPAIHGYAEAHLGPFYKLRRNVLIKDLPQDPFAGAISDFEAHRQPPGELHYAMV